MIYWAVVTALLATLASAENATTPNPLCPYPSDDFVRFPFNGDCTKYWECYQGQRYPMSCPKGLEFNAEESVCDFPDSAKCNTDVTVTYPTFSTGSTTTPTAPTGWTPDPICPYPSDVLTYIVHPTNCSLYYECYQGIKYLMACPAPLVFNIDAEYCDFPENVDCSRTSTSTSDTTTTGTTPTTTTETTTVTTESTASTGTTSSDTTSSSTTTTISPDSTTTTSTETTATTSTDTSTETTTTTTTETTTTSSPGTTTTPANICTGLSDGTFLSDPSDCKRFFECVYGKPVPGYCPLDLLWNEERLTCDYPENVVCNK